ncbi:MAG TPA: acylneuraminate cytidylyltransferase family protein [Pirellulales bacterium]|jgi:CMP-N-acetylneuraminic acid synthetase|nr:acylneuraminate cytidylyltransferase family protein [Pirellulales bacterium]
MTDSNVLGIIPARGQSKRLPRKNLCLLAGKPLLAWAIESARQSRRLNRLIVSSDDDEILAVARAYDEKLPLKRPPELAADDSPAIDYVRHALATLESDASRRFDVVVILQATSPFTQPSDIDATIDLLLTSGADTAVSVMRVDHAVHPVKLKTMSGDRLVPYLEEERGRMAAADLPEVFVRNCSVYATRRGVIESGRIIGDDCRGYLMPRERSVDINEPLDLELAEFLLSRPRGAG